MGQAWHFDPDDPLGALENAGVDIVLRETSESNSVQIQGVTVSESRMAGTEYRFKLPGDPKLKCSFGRENLMKKLYKLFKRELQVGETDFDDTVYIATPDETRTAEFLRDPEVRRLILDIVASGGHVDIDDHTIRVHAIAESDSSAPPSAGEVARLVAHVMDFVSR